MSGNGHRPAPLPDPPPASPPRPRARHPAIVRDQITRARAALALINRLDPELDLVPDTSDPAAVSGVLLQETHTLLAAIAAIDFWQRQRATRAVRESIRRPR
jgi:hypothetical protein